MIAETTQRHIVIFTGRGASISTIESIETLSEAYPHWHFTVLHEHRPRKWGPYLRGKFQRLKREPFSYPAELLGQVLSHVRFRSRRQCKRSIEFPSSYEQISADNVSYRWCSSLSAPDVLETLAQLQPWLGIALSAPILKPDVFDIPEFGTINLHKSLLPNYRGMPPGFWELHDEAAQTGVSVHRVEAGLDTGEVLAQKVLAIPPYATGEGLSARLDLLGHEVLLEAMGRLEADPTSGDAQAETSTPTRSRPAWLVRRALNRKLRRRRKPDRGAMASCRTAAKITVLGVYVYLWAPLRNMYRRLASRSHTTVLLYHRVSDDHLDSVTVGVEQFKKQLALLQRNYEVLDMPTFLSGRQRSGRKSAVVISFDDGYEDNFLAGTLLRRAGLPCAFFLSTRIVGSDRPFEHDLNKLGRRVPTMSWDQVRDLARRGFHFGNHTAEHVNLAQVPLEEGIAQIKTAQRDLQHHLHNGQVLPGLAYPFGLSNDITPQVRDSLEGLGLEYCFSAYGGTNPPDFDPLNVLRQAVDHNFGLLAFRAAIEGWRGWRSTSRGKQP